MSTYTSLESLRKRSSTPTLSTHNTRDQFNSANDKEREIFDGHIRREFYQDKRLIEMTVDVLKWFINPKEGTILNRRLPDLVRMISFYTLFYAILVGIFASFLVVFVFFNALQDAPQLVGTSSGLQFHPSMSVVPMPDFMTSLIRFKQRDKGTYRKYTDDLIAFSMWYENQVGNIQETNPWLDCDHDQRTLGELIKDDRKSCRVNLDMAGPCNRIFNYGYHEGTPCVIVKLNQIYGWMPQIKGNRSGVGIKCHGATEGDDYAMGDICYHDDQYRRQYSYYRQQHPNTAIDREICFNTKEGTLESYYFPYRKQSSYMNPLVFIRFMNPKKYVAILVKCYAIADNIVIDEANGGGFVQFELLVD